MFQIKKHMITINEKHFEHAIKGSKGPAILLINGAGGLVEGWARADEINNLSLEICKE